MMKQQEILDRKHLQAERARAANVAAARLEHQAVLAQAVHVKEHVRSPSFPSFLTDVSLDFS